MLGNIFRRMIVAVTSMLIVAMCTVTNAWAAPIFAYGADIGWVQQLEDEGVKWVDSSNVQQDPLQLLKNNGINSVRLRVFVNPDPSAYWNKDNITMTMLGYGDKASVVTAALRAQNMGMRVMVDFHYSDVFADPGHQIKPVAWQNYSVAQLTTAVYDHTFDVMTDLKAAGVIPEWVQVGNEMDPGIMLPEGGTNNFANLAQFLNAGYDAVKAVSASSKVVTHLAHGTDSAAAQWYFNNFITVHGGKTDVIGFSFYPHWEGEAYWDITDDLAYNLNYMAATYGKEVMVVEVGGLETNPTDSYWTIKDTIDLVKAVPNDKGIGVFYWEPAANSAVLPDGYPLGATTVVADGSLQFTIAMEAFRDSQVIFDSINTYRIVNRNSGKALNVAGGSLLNGEKIEQYTYSAWASQQWTLIAIGNGYYKIRNVNSGLVMDISEASLTDGAQNVQWLDTGTFNQQWQLIDAGDNYYKIINRRSGKLLDISGASTMDGALSIQWSDNGNWNQLWQIIMN